MSTQKKLMGNFFSLSSMQVLNYIFPLITLPYLVRVLGPYHYGLVMFAQAIIQYFVLLTNYGFDLSATSQIALKKSDPSAVSKITSEVFATKSTLMGLSFLILILLVHMVPSIGLNWLLYVASSSYIIANVVFPNWLFQGLEDMKFITLANVVSKALSTVFIFTVIHHPQDYILLPIVNGLSSILGGIFSLIFVMRKYRLLFQYPSLSTIIEQLKDGWMIFLSNISISLYTTSNPVILGFFTTPTEVGYYMAAERLIRAIQGLFGIVSQTIYPHVIQVMNSSITDGIRFLHKVTIYLAPLSAMISIMVFALAHPIITLILGRQYIASVPIIQILAILPLVIFLSNIFGIQTMLPLRFKKAFLFIISASALINIILSLILVPLYGAIGTASSVSVSECFVMLGMYIFLQIKGINLFTGKVSYHGI